MEQNDEKMDNAVTRKFECVARKLKRVTIIYEGYKVGNYNGDCSNVKQRRCVYLLKTSSVFKKGV